LTLGSVESRQQLRISLPVDSNGKLWDLASRAIAQSNQVDSGRAYEEIVRELSARHSGDQRDVAAALQTLAKEVESKLGSQTAFTFKQRSCEVLLVYNMEARRAGRKVVPAAPVGSADNLTVKLAQRAQEAIADSVDQVKTDKIVQEIIEELETVHDKNQREVAAALQRISKQLETDGKADQAFAFKQLSCAAMLKMSMASRRRTFR
jgi:Zn-dependent M16 (insulinase) family peptidase